MFLLAIVQAFSMVGHKWLMVWYRPTQAHPWLCQCLVISTMDLLTISDITTLVLILGKLNICRTPVVSHSQITFFYFKWAARKNLKALFFFLSAHSKGETVVWVHKNRTPGPSYQQIFKESATQYLQYNFCSDRF